MITIVVTDKRLPTVGNNEYPEKIIQNIEKLLLEKEDNTTYHCLDPLSLLAYETFCKKYKIESEFYFEDIVITNNIEYAFSKLAKSYLELDELRFSLEEKE